MGILSVHTEFVRCARVLSLWAKRSVPSAERAGRGAELESLCRTEGGSHETLGRSNGGSDWLGEPVAGRSYGERVRRERTRTRHGIGFGVGEKDAGPAALHAPYRCSSLVRPSHRPFLPPSSARARGLGYTVHTWGDPQAGGDASTVAQSLIGNVLKLGRQR